MSVTVTNATNNTTNNEINNIVNNTVGPPLDEFSQRIDTVGRNFSHILGVFKRKIGRKPIINLY